MEEEEEEGGLDGRVLGREMRLVRGKNGIYSRQKVEKVGMVGGSWKRPWEGGVSEAKVQG